MIELACRHGLGQLESAYRQILSATPREGQTTDVATGALLSAEAYETTIRQVRFDILQAGKQTTPDTLNALTAAIRGRLSELEAGSASSTSPLADKM